MQFQKHIQKLTKNAIDSVTHDHDARCETLLIHPIETESITRVSLVMAYENKAGNPQLSWFMQDFEDEDAALDFYIQKSESGYGKFFTIFGDEYRLSEGSGFRFYRSWN